MSKSVFFIAQRYLLSKHKLNFITIISYLSITGITLGVAALVTILSVFNGFSSVVKSFLVSFDPHIRIEVKDDSAFDKIDSLRTILNHTKGIKSYGGFVQGKVLFINKQKSQIITLKGVEPSTADSIYGVKTTIQSGSFDLEQGNEELPKGLIGFGLASQLDVTLGDTILIISPAGIEKAIAGLSMPQNRKFIISGMYDSRNNDYDFKVMFTDVTTGKGILGYGDNLQGFDLALPDINNADIVKQELLAKVDTSFSINNWYDFHRELYNMMQVERWAAYLILVLIIMVAAFNILASLTMAVIEKKRDIGILLSMGMERKDVTRIFVYQGLIVGLIGTLVGYALALVIYWLQVTYKIYPLDPTRFKIDAMPMELRLLDFVAVGIASFLLSLLAAVYPAIKASKLNPLDAIKWE